MYLVYIINAFFNFELAFEIQAKTVKAVNDVHLRATNKQQASEQNWKLNFHISVGVRYRVRHVLFNGTEWVLLCGWIFEFKIGVLSVELILISTSSDAKRVFFRGEWGFERGEWRLYLVTNLTKIDWMTSLIWIRFFRVIHPSWSEMNRS